MEIGIENIKLIAIQKYIFHCEQRNTYDHYKKFMDSIIPVPYASFSFQLGVYVFGNENLRKMLYYIEYRSGNIKSQTRIPINTPMLSCTLRPFKYTFKYDVSHVRMKNGFYKNEKCFFINATFLLEEKAECAFIAKSQQSFHVQQRWLQRVTYFCGVASYNFSFELS